MKPKLSLITLGVGDLDRSRRFYEALGWEPNNWDPESDIVFFELDGVVLGLYRREDLARDIGIGADIAPGFSAMTLAHNEPSRDEVDRAFAEFVSAGAIVVKQPQPTEWGGYSGYVSDPDGHYWEVAFNPFSDWT
jgi:catechol 2,3-dioxygenase-like lactoylglutathione lyase family enzyme